MRTELIPLPDYSEKSSRIMWYVKNISEEKLSDTYIKINTNMNLRIQAILNGISVGFKISRDDDVYSHYYVGETVTRLFGYTVDEFLKVTNGNAKDNIYSPDIDATLEHIKKELENQNAKLKDYSTMINQMMASLSNGVFAYRLPSYEILALNRSWYGNSK